MHNVINIVALNISDESQVILNDLVKKVITGVKMHFAPESAIYFDFIKEFEADVIIVDFKEQEKNIFEKCQQIKNNKLTQHIPIVILLETKENGTLSKQALKAGCDSMLVKPFDEFELSIILKSMIKIKENNLLRNIENELRIERDRSDSIIEGINAGTWDWNILTNEMSINSRWAEMIGYSINELQPVTINTWNKLIHPRDLIHAERKIARHFQNKIKYYYAEFRMKHKNGNWVWINSRGKVVEYSENGDPVRMAGIHIDITHKKSTGKELIKAKLKAQESDHLKSAFLSNMSHEIRTPMNGILGFIELLKEPDLKPDKQDCYIDIIKKSGERLLSTINDIIELSKIEARESPIQISEVNISVLMQYFLDFFSPQAEKKGITLKYETEIKNNIIVKTDLVKLESILTNLIKNALKFTSTGTIEFGNQIENGKLSFFVKDTGKGIEKDEIELIFERFVQANSNINRGHEGSGLGLSIAKAYTKMLGGEIWVTSDVNKGSTFRFTINYDPVINNKSSKIIEPKENVKEIKFPERQILVAEDDDFNFLLIEQFLSGMNFKLIHTSNGQETIDVCKENPTIDLILMDIKMQVLDGLTAGKEIRKFRPNLPIIAQSAYALTHEIEQFTQFFDDYITKPITKAELKQKVLKFIK